MTQGYLHRRYQTWRRLLHPEDHLRAGPVLLELVVIALGRGEHVHDHAPEVDQHPVALGRALAAEWLDALVAQRLEDAVRDRGDLPLRAAGADDERVRDRRELAEVEEHDVGRL